MERETAEKNGTTKYAYASYRAFLAKEIRVFLMKPDLNPSHARELRSVNTDTEAGAQSAEQSLIAAGWKGNTNLKSVR